MTVDTSPEVLDALEKRLRRTDEYEPLGHDGWEAAEVIAALREKHLGAERVCDLLDNQRRDAVLRSELLDHEAVAVRYDFDGHGWQYLDSGSGSDWLTRKPDAEPLYIKVNK